MLFHVRNTHTHIYCIQYTVYSTCIVCKDSGPVIYVTIKDVAACQETYAPYVFSITNVIVWMYLYSIDFS